ncbi:hypothetical protein [Acinetobacter gerneri]|uniref:Uncharacterized protein n=3 Tax=Acinetobacter gerneri TaxID=202952 RepID=N8Y7W3_9GAMM|nr:hypothetical protein [Acinetobacter gerneri]ENV32857.1 hypothetical protein F960_03032 [Acinetobacter gerneri DSM 14967 = CIP 107464 = MTCC 9824]EPR85411.1 hypothetical protein L289_1721 [Acinetobacter gerneri DSM 14967 = CIP 107464 = MTCC 9824]MDQ9008197.1 hypothetical protein [Acinetobacter gerneri]MDQ9012389.1 hypothetical protein [Acinetobacter gerneri]MDQ9023736.1 hypothetical protein [Acinetobacter gerneri]
MKVDKKIKQIYFRQGEHPMILLSIFIYSAKRQNWHFNEIKTVVTEARRKDYAHLVKTLKSYA